MLAWLYLLYTEQSLSPRPNCQYSYSSNSAGRVVSLCISCCDGAQAVVHDNKVDFDSSLRVCGSVFY